MEVANKHVQKNERLGLLLTLAEKTAVVQMAEAEGGLPQSALVRRLIRNAARERGVWLCAARPCACNVMPPHSVCTPSA